jgi:HAD superfamily hydrolase (TIGR01509 family)
MRFIMTSSSVTDNSQRPARKPHAAVFDCDGLLVDSQRCWDDAYARIAVDRGRSPGEIRLECLLGASVGRAASLLSGDLGEEVSAAELRAALEERFADDPPAALPGARELVAELAARMPVGVASNGPRDIVLGVLDQLDLREAFSAVVSAEETARDKPDPHVYLEACRRLAVAPRDSVAFEDSPLGAQAARRAGLAVVLVPSGPAPGVEADLVVPSLDDERVRTFVGLEPVAIPS